MGGSSGSTDDVDCFVKGSVEGNSFSGTLWYPPSFSESTFPFSGTVDECGGIVTLGGGWELADLSFFFFLSNKYLRHKPQNKRGSN